MCKRLISNRYDFILIDCSPSLSILTCNALLVSDFYIVPTIPNYLSRIGFNILSHKIRICPQITCTNGV
ncbi:ParA family protein [Candidatus Magnetobacterium casense]|uniref:ParA family protein n=1 Tax=Candidatus Magnetobacterium casense TaxID=1455061 RepID=UPI0009DD0655